jgi:hypothetical protein
MIPKMISDLCTPALAYLILAAVSFASLLAQNMSDSSKFCMGKMSCQVPHVALVLIGKALYIAFWTWAINSLCRAGYKKTAWAVFFLPLLMFFVGAAVMIMMVGFLEHQSKQDNVQGQM